MMLRWWGDHRDDDALIRCASRIDYAVEATLAAGIRTADLGGIASTREFGDVVAAATACTPA